MAWEPRKGRVDGGEAGGLANTLCPPSNAFDVMIPPHGQSLDLTVTMCASTSLTTRSWWWRGACHNATCSPSLPRALPNASLSRPPFRPPSTPTTTTHPTGFFFPYPYIYQAWRAAAAATSDEDAVASAEAVETEEATVVVAVAAGVGVAATRTGRRRAGPP